ncbi:MAG: hypothetical protein ACRD0X_03140 [Thermoanaerobaculia bacterium]
MSCRSLLGVLLGTVALATPAWGDVVHLVNGRKLEGVIAEVGEQRVLIRLEFGDLALPRAMVARVERADSALLEYQARRAMLTAQGAGPEQWLELARWARDAGLEHAAAQAALRAVELAPGSAEAAGLLTALDFLEDEATGQWLPFEEAMSRRGYVTFHGAWISREEATAALAAEAQHERERATADREGRLARAVELLAVAQVAGARSGPPYPPWGTPVWGYPVAVFPGFIDLDVGRPIKVPMRPQGAPSLPSRGALDDLLHRNPGSLLPVGEPARHLRSSFSKPGE